ncbi:uncharacterized protein ZK546.14-like [Diabrotica virgifera virgifera]|uniref:Uncharacterized protein n=1 Tax=Diabrotica virgifera virgifera TaxID=50390 RepID=A0ABM5JR88_DIAVI|nr:uncharacterized protein ZK546.14-like [Diabrotica virgifera virgifera]
MTDVAPKTPNKRISLGVKNNSTKKVKLENEQTPKQPGFAIKQIGQPSPKQQTKLDPKQNQQTPKTPKSQIKTPKQEISVKQEQKQQTPKQQVVASGNPDNAKKAKAIKAIDKKIKLIESRPELTKTGNRKLHLLKKFKRRAQGLPPLVKSRGKAKKKKAVAGKQNKRQKGKVQKVVKKELEDNSDDDEETVVSEAKIQKVVTKQEADSDDDDSEMTKPKSNKRNFGDKGKFSQKRKQGIGKRNQKFKNNKKNKGGPNVHKNFPKKQVQDVKPDVEKNEIKNDVVQAGSFIGNPDKNPKKDPFFIIKQKVNSSDNHEKEKIIKELENKINAIESRGQLTNTATRKLRQLKKYKKLAEGGQLNSPPEKTKHGKTKTEKRRERRVAAAATKKETVALNKTKVTKSVGKKSAEPESTAEKSDDEVEGAEEESSEGASNAGEDESDS